MSAPLAEVDPEIAAVLDADKLDRPLGGDVERALALVQAGLLA